MGRVGGKGWLAVLSQVGANASGVGKYRHEHCNEQHREPSQGTESHVRASRCGPRDPRFGGSEGQVTLVITLVGVGSLPALLRTR